MKKAVAFIPGAAFGRMEKAMFVCLMQPAWKLSRSHETT